MQTTKLLYYYVSWHYGRALRDFKSVYSGFISFFFNFFSIPLLVETLFDPWRRLMDEKKEKGLIEGALGKIIVNFLMRIVGFGMRTITIVIGLAATAVAAVVGIILFLVWLALPLILVFLFFAGLKGLLAL
jgi:hypothetical protein